MKHFITKFALRWVASTLGLWIAASLLGSERLEVGREFATILGAGFILALVNTAIKPLLVILSFPAIIVSLGLFMLVINGLTILIASWLYNSLYVKNFGVAVVAGIVLGLVNYLVAHIVKDL